MTGSRSEHHLQNDNFILFVMSLSVFCMLTFGNWEKSLHWSMHTARWFYYIRLQFCFVLLSQCPAGGGWILSVTHQLLCLNFSYNLGPLLMHNVSVCCDCHRISFLINHKAWRTGTDKKGIQKNITSPERVW